ncbi:MAG: hypothetical protein ACYDHX_14600 [Methanothrix sp.]
MPILIIAVPAATVISQPEILRPPCAMPGIDCIIDPSYWRRNEEISYLLASFSIRGQDIPALVYKDISTFRTLQEIAIKRTILLNLKHAIINDDGLHLEIIKAFTALEVQEFEALDDSILKRF